MSVNIRKLGKREKNYRSSQNISKNLRIYQKIIDSIRKCQYLLKNV